MKEVIENLNYIMVHFQDLLLFKKYFLILVILWCASCRFRRRWLGFAMKRIRVGYWYRSSWLCFCWFTSKLNTECVIVFLFFYWSLSIKPCSVVHSFASVPAYCFAWLLFLVFQSSTNLERRLISNSAVSLLFDLEIWRDTVPNVLVTYCLCRYRLVGMTKHVFTL